MFENKSPLAAATFENAGVTLREAPDFILTLCAGSGISLRRELGVIPDFGTAAQINQNTYFRLAPEQILVVGPEPETRLCAATPLSSGRCRIEVCGAKARNLLASCAAVDFSAQAFPLNAVAMTAIHHTPVLIHALPDEGFHIYGLRTFAVSLWDWLLDVAQTLG